LILFVFLIWILPFFIIGFFIHSIEGAITGAVLALSMLTVNLIGGKNTILFLSKARRTVDLNILQIVDNYSCVLGLKNVEVYYSRFFPNNIFFAQSLISNPCIIVGNDLQERLLKGELEILIFSALHRIQMGDAKFRTSLTTIMAFLNIFSVILSKNRIFQSSSLKSYILFLSQPFKIISAFLFSNRRDILEFDRSTVKITNRQKELSSALFKLSSVPFCQQGLENSFSKDVLENLAILENKQNDLIHGLSNIGVDTQERCLALSKS
jgi:hypothetical protein